MNFPALHPGNISLPIWAAEAEVGPEKLEIKAEVGCHSKLCWGSSNQKKHPKAHRLVPGCGLLATEASQTCHTRSIQGMQEHQHKPASAAADFPLMGTRSFPLETARRGQQHLTHSKRTSRAGELKHGAAGSCQRPGWEKISAQVWLGVFLSFLHRGCFSFVKRVVHKGNRVSCAAKFIPLRSKTKSRAHQERDILASLSHDRITRLLDEFETRKTLILILELYPFLCSCLKRLRSNG